MTSYQTTVPANTTATLYLPIPEKIEEFNNISGVRFIQKTFHLSTSVAEYELESGTFRFIINNHQVVVHN